jgi:hypothetical protein
METNTRKNALLYATLFVLTCLVTATTARAQTPSPSPSSEPTTIGGFEVTSSIEIGVRGLDVNGDHDKYRSDLNYRPGFRIFDSSFMLENKSAGARPFDSLLVQSSGWGSDPQGTFRLNMDRIGIYKFDSNVRRVRYFNNLKNHAVNFSQPVSTGSEHRANTLHHFGDFDLTLLPERKVRYRVGYSFNNTEGPGTNTIRFSGDEYQVNSTTKTHSDDFRLGVEGTVFGFNMGINYGRRNFRDNTRFFSDSFNSGNNPASTTSFLSRGFRQFRVKGTTDFVHGFVQRTFARRLDFTGRFIYAESRSKINENDLLSGRASATGNIIIGDTIDIPGNANRPQARGDLGITYRITDDFRISNTFTFDQFNIAGSNTLFEFVNQTTGAGVPNSTTSFSSALRGTSYRRISNLIEGDYQVNRHFAFNLGYRFTHREVVVRKYDVNLLTGAIQRNLREDLENSTHTFIAGSRIKPIDNWSIYLDLERGESDNVFTRLANNDFFNFRARSIANVKRFTFNVSFITKNNQDIGTSTDIFNSAGTQIIFPAMPATADSKTRIFSSSIDWTPRTDLSFSGGYTYNHQTAKTDIIVPIGTPIVTATQFRAGISEYYLRDSYFFFDVTARPIRRVSLYAAYRFNDDSGQGDRVITRPEDIITSYPMTSHMPEVKLAIRLTKNIDWNLGYQYYSYEEIPHFSPFANPLVRFPAQNYTAHMPYTSLRFYFGRAAGDR